MITASGGLSHFIIDEEIDRMLLDGLLSKNKEKLSKLPVERLLVLGTAEGLNWITAAGALKALSRSFWAISPAIAPRRALAAPWASCSGCKEADYGYRGSA